MGSRTVLAIAPAATIFAFMVGITLGLPAGYYGRRLDTVLSFLANLVLAFPVILLFYLLVTPEVRSTGIPLWLAGVLFLFPIIFLCTLFTSRYSEQKNKLMWIWRSNHRARLLGVFGIGLQRRSAWRVLHGPQPAQYLRGGGVRELAHGVPYRSRPDDRYQNAGLCGGGPDPWREQPWYIMLWEVLPNARGPLIVDFCLRIGYTTILSEPSASSAWASVRKARIGA